MISTKQRFTAEEAAERGRGGFGHERRHDRGRRSLARSSPRAPGLFHATRAHGGGVEPGTAIRRLVHDENMKG